MKKDTQFNTAVRKTLDNHTAKYSVDSVFSPITKHFLPSEIISYLEDFSLGNEAYFNECRNGERNGTFMALLGTINIYAKRHEKFSETRKALLNQIKLAKAILETPKYGATIHNAKEYISDCTTNSYISGLKTALDELDTKAQLHYLARWSLLQFVKDNPKIAGNYNYKQDLPQCIALK
jgi:hypothetical protein